MDVKDPFITKGLDFYLSISSSTDDANEDAIHWFFFVFVGNWGQFKATSSGNKGRGEENANINNWEALTKTKLDW